MKIELTIPETFSDITVEQYQKFFRIAENNAHGDFLNQKTIEILCNTQHANLIPFNEVQDILQSIEQIFKSKPKHLQKIKIDNIEFGFIPDLDKMSFGEFIDINNYIDNVEDFHKALAVLYRPITTKLKGMYLIEDYKGSEVYSQLMKKAPLEAILGAKVFFYNLANELLKATTDSLQTIPAEQMEIIRQRLHLVKDGDGINLFTESLKETFDGLMR
jgi:hypothetical protein